MCLSSVLQATCDVLPDRLPAPGPPDLLLSPPTQQVCLHAAAALHKHGICGVHWQVCLIGTSPAKATSLPGSAGALPILSCRQARTRQHCCHATSCCAAEPPPMDVRLKNGKNGNEGRLEVLIGGRWSTVCQ